MTGAFWLLVGLFAIAAQGPLRVESWTFEKAEAEDVYHGRDGEHETIVGQASQAPKKGLLGSVFDKMEKFFNNIQQKKGEAQESVAAKWGNSEGAMGKWEDSKGGMGKWGNSEGGKGKWGGNSYMKRKGGSGDGSWGSGIGKGSGRSSGGKSWTSGDRREKKHGKYPMTRPAPHDQHHSEHHGLLGWLMSGLKNESMPLLLTRVATQFIMKAQKEWEGWEKFEERYNQIDSMNMDELTTLTEDFMAWKKEKMTDMVPKTKNDDSKWWHDLQKKAQKIWGKIKSETDDVGDMQKEAMAAITSLAKKADLFCGETPDDVPGTLYLCTNAAKAPMSYPEATYADVRVEPALRPVPYYPVDMAPMPIEVDPYFGGMLVDQDGYEGSGEYLDMYP